MAQKTNLNVSPYFEDFDSTKGYYKVLFAPGRAVQGRELNNLQAQLQNQIERFGNHIFQDGSMVIPGGVTYDSKFYAVKLKNLQFGVDIGLYIKSFIGTKITGTESGITATVDYVALQNESDEVKYITLYVKYLNSDINNEISQFYDGESFFADRDVSYGNTTIVAGTNFATAIDENSTSVGSAAHVNRGVYFIRGFFVEVSKQTIILDYYNNTPSYKIGFTVNENVITAKDDESLYDNAKGFTNYAAPGADRFQISLTLDKRLLTNNSDPNFIELIRTDEGEIKKEETTTQYSLIKDYLAKRTYDESGDYTVEPFKITVNESLNDREGNNGLFFSNELTDQENTPSDNLACVKISPGIAYVGGYDVNKSFTTILDLEKPRTIEQQENISVEFNLGNIIRVNNVYGCPIFGEEISLYGRRKTLSSGEPSNKIGSARVYSFNLTDSPYKNNSTSWDLRLFDIQTFTRLTINSDLSDSQLPAGSFVKGKSSGASGHTTSNFGGTSVIVLNQTSGRFVKGEQLIINGVETLSRTTIEVEVFDSSQIKSVYTSSGFVADTILKEGVLPGFSSQDEFKLTGGGEVTSPGRFFSSVKPGTIVSYIGDGSEVHYNRVNSVSLDGTSIQLAPETLSVTGVCDGTIGVSIDTTLRLRSRTPEIVNSQNGGLYINLPQPNIAEVNLNNSSITFKAQATDNAATGTSLVLDSGDFNLPVGLSTASFNAFDQERYSIHYTNGTVESLSSEQVVLDGLQNQISFNGISGGTRDVVIGTLVKRGIQSKTKVYNKSKIVNYEYSRLETSGTDDDNSISDGLTYNNIYGIRVQDEDLCLLYPDVARIICVRESLDSLPPTFDQVTFSSLFNVFGRSVVGENIVGKESGALARIVRKSSSLPNNLEIVYLNSDTFVVGETVEFTQSNFTATIDSLILGEYKNITNRYFLDKGQRTQYYDYSRLIRRSGEEAPSRRITVVFDYYSVPQNDTGDVYTVLSYPSEQYTDFIPVIGGDISLATNTLDFRPKVSAITDISSVTKSPFEFSSRNSIQNDLKVVVAPNEISILGIGYYLPRIDKIYLGRDGTFSIVQGKPALNPKSPEDVDLLMPLATLIHPAYLNSARSSFIKLNINKRYTMKDIGGLDSRLRNLERTVSLSLLEVNTEAFQIRDADGLNQFKTGFFVDDFDNNDFIDNQLSNIEVSNGLMAPFETETTIPNVPEVINSGETDPLSGNLILKSNDGGIRFTGDLDNPRTLTLDYESVDWLEQPIATRVENINPFHVVEYIGEVSLNPSEDRWVRSALLLPERVIRKTTNLSTTNTIVNDITRTIKKTQDQDVTRILNARAWERKFGDIGVEGETKEKTSLGQSSSSVKTKTFTNGNTSTDESTNINTIRRLIGVDNDRFIRSRNVEFTASGLKPFTRFYQFLDNQSGVKAIPKIIKISPISGNFTTGEDVIGYAISSGSDDAAITTNRIIRFRLAKPNHKRGDISEPSEVFTLSPYTRNTLPSQYSNNSEYLNIDTVSLAVEAQGEYFGCLSGRVKFVGQTSGAVAHLSDSQLISDASGDLIGTFFLDDPNSNPAPNVRISTGTKTYKITSSDTNASPLPGSKDISSAETTYDATGLVNTFQDETTIETTRITSTVNVVTNLNTVTVKRTRRNVTFKRVDPLAQSFEVGRTSQAPSNSSVDPISDRDGAYLTAVDIYFRSVDSGNSPVTIQIRSMELGTPTLQVIGESVVLRPGDTVPGGKTLRESVSEDASIATTIIFPYPIYLEPDNEYAVVLLAPESIEYEVFIAEMNEQSLNQSSLTGLPEAERVKYSKQFAIGSLFKSQNGSIWTADQNQDLKFKLYKAQFDTTGTAFFYNPVINARSAPSYFSPIGKNPIQVYPRKLAVKVTTSNIANFNNISIGSKVTGASNTWKYGYVENFGGPATSVGISTVGNNYENETGLETFNIIGNGAGLTVDITQTGGQLSTVSVNNAGSGYKIGDLVGIVTSSTTNGVGLGAEITISDITQYDTLYLTRVQGENITSGGSLQYFSAGNPIPVFAGINVISSTILNSIYDGITAKITQFTHGMYSTANKVELTNVIGNNKSALLVSNINIETNQINLNDSTLFENFELAPVSASNPGYVVIQDEIIKYTGVSSNSLTGISRGIDNTVPSIYSTGQPVKKYELAGVSLRRINTTNNIADIPTPIDSYYIKLDRGSISSSGIEIGADRTTDGSLTNSPQISFDTEAFLGGENASATQNIIYSKINPKYDIFGPGTGISIDASVRTVSSTSVSGNETSFLDQGYSPVQINRINEFRTLRGVYSRVNEEEMLTDLPNSKSFTTAITLSTTNRNLSPQIFLDGSVTNFTVQRLDKPVESYIIDGRANEIFDLSHAATYVSNIVLLEQPSTSLKVLLSAYRHFSSDFRVLYSLVLADSFEVAQSYNLFPGYRNLTLDNDQNGFLDVVDLAKSDGTPDRLVPPSLDGEFLEYEYTAPDLPEFIGYSIKIVMSGIDQANVPAFKNIRTIALA